MSALVLLGLGCITDAVRPDGYVTTTTRYGDPFDSDPSANDDTGETPGTDDSEPEHTGDNDDPLVGEWLSEDGNISPLLASFYVRVVGKFENGGGYSVVATRENGNIDTLTGTYGVGLDTNPATINLDQELPYAAEAEGIWQISGDTLTYEIVQTNPNSYGYVAPTPSGGFGSSSGGSLQPGDNVQIFVRL